MVNLGGISTSLFESEMFGHSKGAYTGAVSERKGRFELADKGTIFLDEIGDLTQDCQVKLLRVLQQHTFERLGESRTRKTDIRAICATNADLPATHSRCAYPHSVSVATTFLSSQGISWSRHQGLTASVARRFLMRRSVTFRVSPIRAM